MEEADKLCAHAIVDHATWWRSALHRVEAHFRRNVVECTSSRAESWRAAEGLRSHQVQRRARLIIVSLPPVPKPPCTVELAASLGETLTLSRQNTTSRCVHHYTGAKLRDEQVKPCLPMPPGPEYSHERMFAIIERGCASSSARHADDTCR